MILKKPNLWLPSRRALLTGAAAAAAYSSLNQPALAAIGTPTSLGIDIIGYEAALIAGNTAIAVILIADTGSTSQVTAVSDPTNNYSFCQRTGYGGGILNMEVWRCDNVGAQSSGTPITTTTSGTPLEAITSILQVSGLASPSYDTGNGGTGINTTGSTTASASTLTLSQSSELIIGAAGNANRDGWSGSASGFTSLGNTTTFIFEYQIVNTTTAVTFSQNLASSDAWVATASPFKGAGGGAAATPQRMLLGVGR